MVYQGTPLSSIQHPFGRFIGIWVFPKIGVPKHGWFIMENPIKMDDLGGKPTIFGNILIGVYKFS